MVVNKDNKSSLMDIIINGVIPIIILMKLSDENYLGPLYGFILALSFPFFYGAYELVFLKKFNFLSIVGFVSVILTGGIGLLKLDPSWVAVKEALVPLVIGIGITISQKTKYPLLNIIFDKVINMEKIKDCALKLGKTKEFAKTFYLTKVLIICSFFVSALLNYVLAVMIVKSPPGTVAFNEEIGRMTALSFLVIALPVTLLLAFSLYYFCYKMKKITGYEIKDILKSM